MKQPILSEYVRSCQTPETLRALGYITPTAIPSVFPPSDPAPKRKKPTKTEARYLQLLNARELAGEISDILFHPCNLYMQNGHRYTPDFKYRMNGNIYMVEVKGSYKLQSYQRARLAYDQTRIEWPMFSWVWAVWDKVEWIET